MLTAGDAGKAHLFCRIAREKVPQGVSAERNIFTSLRSIKSAAKSRVASIKKRPLMRRADQKSFLGDDYAVLP